MQDNFEAAKKAENAHKNRYRDVLPYDSTRVRLFPVPSEPGSDYINANFIQVGHLVWRAPHVLFVRRARVVWHRVGDVLSVWRVS